MNFNSIFLQIQGHLKAGKDKKRREWLELHENSSPKAKYRRLASQMKSHAAQKRQNKQVEIPNKFYLQDKEFESQNLKNVAK